MLEKEKGLEEKSIRKFAVFNWRYGFILWLYLQLTYEQARTFT